MAHLEHVNVTVRDPDAVAALMADLFDWRVRWSGTAMDTGRSVHVGGEDNYVAFYTSGTAPTDGPSTYATSGGLNHLGVVVDDLDATEARVKAAGFAPHAHGDYEPGRRFYFDGPDGIEIEVVSYGQTL
ncbi:MAG: VOC family protein [Pseudomonadota bacterium]